MGKSTPVTDHEGTPFPSITAMCREWEVHPQTYSSRLKYGFTQEEALTGMMDVEGEKVPILTGTQTRPVRDHKGVLFLNFREMAEAHGVNYSTFRRRKAQGWSLEECLTKEVLPDRVPKYGEHCRMPCVDHEGNEFPSKLDMCRHYGVEYRHFQRRITEYGWSLRDALLGRDDIGSKGKKVPIQDPVDETLTHDSISAMCRYYGVKESTYRTRVDRDGLTMKQALGLEK